MQPAASFRLTARPTRVITSTSGKAAGAPDTAPSLDTSQRRATGGLISITGASASSVGKPQPLLDAAAAAAGGAKCDGFFFVPPTYDPSLPSPMVVMLHGAGGRAFPTDSYHTFGGLQDLDASRCILMVPESRGLTWDAIRCSFGPDGTHINRALNKIFASYAVDPTHVALAGFLILLRPVAGTPQRRPINPRHRILPGLHGRTRSGGSAGAAATAEGVHHSQRQ
ncbi:hypothetical protein Vafri_19269 [Volvox africanus]|uniref:Uncharacterized protein n=1 Tax=Volvox africanus TaxID=51714 RepID=A0A8J4BUC0_9CHLO|nr:hypothetical protein Vafri_19269 [Volvox africanus]